MHVTDAAEEVVDEFLPLFMRRPTKEHRAITTCAILQCIAPSETEPDFLDAVYRHKVHGRATRRVLAAVQGDGLLALCGATLERMNASRR